MHVGRQVDEVERGAIMHLHQVPNLVVRPSNLISGVTPNTLRKNWVSNGEPVGFEKCETSYLGGP